MGLSTILILLVSIVRYKYLIISRHELIVVAFGIFGVVMFDVLLMALSVFFPDSQVMVGVAFSRIMRLTLFASLFWVIQVSGRRQRLAEIIESEILDSGVD